MALGAFYAAPSTILSPSPAADRSLIGLGADPARIGRWERGVDVESFDPGKADREAFPGEIKVLYAGPADPREGGRPARRELRPRPHRRPPAAPAARRRRPRGGGAARQAGRAATFLGWLGTEELARAYASADLFLFCSRTDTYGQVVVEAGASGLPVVAVAEGGPASLIENRHTGILCRADADQLAGSVLQLASSPLLRRHLGASAMRAARERSWERALEQLADGYRRALEAGARQAASRAA